MIWTGDQTLSRSREREANLRTTTATPVSHDLAGCVMLPFVRLTSNNSIVLSLRIYSRVLPEAFFQVRDNLVFIARHRFLPLLLMRSGIGSCLES